jgi:predicted RNA-binding Zn-ribbon protein involved in translation (DUF1610 family)
MHARGRFRVPTWTAALLMLLGMPLWIPILVALDVVGKRRLRAAAASFACANCGRTLGVDAVTLSDKEWQEFVRTLIRENPGMRYRLVRTVHAICPGCGARYTFRESDRTFVVEHTPVPGHPPAPAQNARPGVAGG